MESPVTDFRGILVEEWMEEHNLCLLNSVSAPIFGDHDRFDMGHATSKAVAIRDWRVEAG